MRMRFETTKHPARRGIPDIDMGPYYVELITISSYLGGTTATVEKVIRKKERPGKNSWIAREAAKAKENQC